MGSLEERTAINTSFFLNRALPVSFWAIGLMRSCYGTPVLLSEVLVSSFNAGWGMLACPESRPILPDHPFGRDVANRGLYTALAAYGGFEQITNLNPSSSTVGAHPSRLALRPPQTAAAVGRGFCFVVSYFPNWHGSGGSRRLTAWWGYPSLPPVRELIGEVWLLPCGHGILFARSQCVIAYEFIDSWQII